MENVDITLNITYTKKEFAKYTFRSEYIYSNALLKFIPLYLILIVMSILSFFYYKNANSGIFTIFVSLLVPLFISYKFNKSVNKDYKDYFTNGLNVRFNELGIEGSVFGETSFINYEDIHKVTEDEEVIYIFLNSFICLFIPKKFISTDDMKIISPFLFDVESGS